MSISRHISNLPGWRAKSKYVVFESDDWGSIRMPNLKTFNLLKKAGIDIDSGQNLRYNLNDTLASKDDLSALYEILSSVKDKAGNHAVFTPVSLIANPDFEKIQSSEYRDYYYEPFTKTLKRYDRENAFPMWQEGINKRLFVPQFHGREHLNVAVWMDALRNQDRDALIAFDYGCWGFTNKHSSGISFQAAFDVHKPQDVELQGEIIKDGLDLFEKIFGYRACFFVPPNGPFNESLLSTCVKNGIKYLSTSKIHNEPQGNGTFRKKFRYLGKKKNGITYLTRNAFFEPSSIGKDWVNSCLNDIQIAFNWHKPAMISTHRVNYIGGLQPANRDNGLKKLKELLSAIVQKWPDVQFLNSEELGGKITGK